MSLWAVAEVPTASKMNTKTIFVGATAPTSTFAGQIWIDTTTDPPRVRVRNSANTAFRDASVSICSAVAEGSIAVATAARYHPLWGSRAWESAIADANSLMELPGRLKNVRVRVTANDITATNNSTFKLFKNEVATALTITLSNSTTGDFTETATEVTFAQGDRLAWELIAGNPAGTGSITVRGISAQLGFNTANI